MNIFSLSDINWASIAASLLAVGIIILLTVIGIVIARKMITRMTIHTRLGKNTQQRVKTIQSILVNTVTYVIIFIAFVAILDQFHINVSALLASAGVLGLAIGFGAKDLVTDIVSGFFILLEDQVQVGEDVTVNGFSGTVEHIGLRVLKIRDQEGDLHFILNREIKSLTNHSRGFRLAKVDLPLASHNDLDEAIAHLQEHCRQIADKLDGVMEGPQVLGVIDVTPQASVVRIQARCENGKQAEVERILRKELRKIIDASGYLLSESTQV
ncbi:MAG: mechanosensitive ion channel family protein [Thermoactinomyces sp.]